MSRYRVLLITSAVVLLLDQMTKWYIDTRFFLGESVIVLENFFQITYVRNPGAAFGLLSEHAIRLPFFITVAVAASAGILWYLRRLEDGQKLLVFALSLVFSGAVGNLIDRIRIGEVIDFIYVHWYEHYWPAFNVADSAITVGVALLLFVSWQEERLQKKS